MRDKASRTAADVAYLRAINSLAPLPQRIMHDPLALAMIPPPWRITRPLLALPGGAAALHRLTQTASRVLAGASGLPELIAIRFRYIEERLQLALQQGCRQVVLLGAGYDFRPYRPQLAQLRIIEIDHPQTQAAKRALLQQCGRPLPANVCYLPVDFMGDWAASLADSGLLLDVPTLVIWEGVIYYLDRHAVDYTFNALARLLPAGSRIVFDCVPDLQRCEIARECPHIQRVARYVAGKGEPFLWGALRSEVEQLLQQFDYRLNAIETFDAILRRLMLAERLDVACAPILRHFFLVEAGIG